jgi:hypothetical protein
MSWPWERWAGIAGIAYVVLYVGAFALGIEVGASDREILEYYADSGNRTKELIAFFVIAAAALAFVLFASGLRNLMAPVGRTLADISWGGAVAYATLTLAGNAVSRATAFAAMDTDVFELDPNTRRLFEDAGLLLLASGALAALARLGGLRRRGPAPARHRLHRLFSPLRLGSRGERGADRPTAFRPHIAGALPAALTMPLRVRRPGAAGGDLVQPLGV